VSCLLCQHSLDALSMQSDFAASFPVPHLTLLSGLFFSLPVSRALLPGDKSLFLAFPIIVACHLVIRAQLQLQSPARELRSISRP
jgi:hypothetical protein